MYASTYALKKTPCVTSCCQEVLRRGVKKGAGDVTCVGTPLECTPYSAPGQEEEEQEEEEGRPMFPHVSAALRLIGCAC